MFRFYDDSRKDPNPCYYYGNGSSDSLLAPSPSSSTRNSAEMSRPIPGPPGQGPGWVPPHTSGDTRRPAHETAGKALPAIRSATKTVMGWWGGTKKTHKPLDGRPATMQKRSRLSMVAATQVRPHPTLATSALVRLPTTVPATKSRHSGAAERHAEYAQNRGSGMRYATPAVDETTSMHNHTVGPKDGQPKPLGEETAERMNALLQKYEAGASGV